MPRKKRFFILQDVRMSVLQIIGAAALLLGLGLLIFIGFYNFSMDGKLPDPDRMKDQVSTLAATSFFMVMMGIALLFPDMLKGNDNSTSTMRVAVFMIVSVFTMLCVKIYWHCAPCDFKLDNAWASVIAAALGSKALQSLGENRAFSRTPPTPPVAGSSLADNLPLAPDFPLHDTNIITEPPATPPASLRAKKNSI